MTQPKSTIIKPLLAKDVQEDKLKFPLIISPKIDGSFGFIQSDHLMARSLKPHENIFSTYKWSCPQFEGLRGELTLGGNPTAENLCRDTSSALRTIYGEPEIHLWCFDYITHETKNLPYSARLAVLEAKINELNTHGYEHIHLIPTYVIDNLQEYREYRDRFLQKGYEGCIVRDPKATHKEGRSSSVRADLWRWKPWSSAEIRVTHLVDEMKNNNEAKVNALGHTERSTHKENLTSKGMLGAIVGKLVTPLLDCYGKMIAEIGTDVTIATGSLKEKECKFYWDNPSELMDKVVEFEYFSYGLKEKPRFAQFKRIRSEVDMG